MIAFPLLGVDVKRSYLFLIAVVMLAWTGLVWYLANTTSPRVLKIPGNGGISGLCLSRDTHLLVAGCDDNTVRIWSVGSGSLTTTLHGFAGRNGAVAISDDGQLLAFSSSTQHAIEIRRLDKPHEASTCLFGHTAPLRALAFSRDGILASAGLDNTVILWDTRTGERIATLLGHTEGILALAFSEDGKLLASGGSDDSVRVWQVPSGESMLTLQGHTGVVTCLAFLGSSPILASGSGDRSIRLWDGETGNKITEFKGHPTAVTRLACTRDGKMLASADAYSGPRKLDHQVSYSGGPGKG
jgi:WD40 repeat protein